MSGPDAKRLLDAYDEARLAARLAPSSSAALQAAVNARGAILQALMGAGS